MLTRCRWMIILETAMADFERRKEELLHPVRDNSTNRPPTKIARTATTERVRVCFPAKYFPPFFSPRLKWE